MAALAATALGACADGVQGSGGCAIAQDVVVPGSPLTLLATAHLQRIGTGFALTGVDPDGSTIRWAAFDDTAGALGPEGAMASPAADAGPWVTLASDQAPGDSLLVAAAVTAANGLDAELHVVVVPASASPATSPALGPALAIVPGAFANGGAPTVALEASRSGPYAVLAWIDPTAGSVMELALSSATGEPVGAATSLEAAPALFGCLAFAAGKGAFTLVYYQYATATATTPTVVIQELRGAGIVDSSVEITLDSHAAGCSQVTPTDSGYALAFQDTEASWLTVYDGKTNAVTIAPFASAVSFGGASLQPPLAGLAPVGKDFAVVLDRVQGGELWRLSVGGGQTGLLVLPSVQGTIGGISAVPDSGSLTATYADYSSVDAGVGTAGQRYLLRLSCQ
jgi:hypothetical protein